MNRHAHIDAPDGPILITADASKVSGADFYHAVKSAFTPAKTRISERGDVASEFISKAWGKSHAETEILRAEMNAKLAEIDERYSGWGLAEQAAMRVGL